MIDLPVPTAFPSNPDIVPNVGDRMLLDKLYDPRQLPMIVYDVDIIADFGVCIYPRYTIV